MKANARLLLGTLVTISAGCMSWTPGWELRPTRSSQTDAAMLLLRARATFDGADTAAKVKLAIESFEAASMADPANVDAATGACEAWCLLGAGYETRRSAKRHAYTAAVQHCERAMAINPEFARRIGAGESIDTAVTALGPAEMGAMHFWVTAVSYRFKETLPPLLYPFNLRWIERERVLLEQMTGVDPSWGDGAVAFAQAIFLLALPERFGGDMTRSRELLDTLVEAYPASLLPRWGRAKYYFDKTGDREAQGRDLRWVVARDPATANGQYPWNVYFHADAVRMLADL